VSGGAPGWLDALLHYGAIAARAIENAGMVAALIAFTAILAAVCGLFGWRMRLYGAIVGGMLVNAIVKAEGGGFAAALAAMLIATALGFALGSVPVLVRVLNTRRG
jgi:hypothetical protein